MSKFFAENFITVSYDGLVATNKYNTDASHVEYEIIEGPGKGSKGKSSCEWSEVSEGVYLISWQEDSGATVVHLDDFKKCTSMTFFSTANNEFYRLKGTLVVKGNSLSS